MIALLLALSTAADQAPPIDTKAPHRTAIERLPVTGNPAEFAGCAARVMSRNGRVTTAPLADGVALDWALTMPVGLYSGGPSYASLQFRSDANGSYVQALYRKPFTAGGVTDFTRNVAKTCFAADWNAWAVANGGKPLK